MQGILSVNQRLEVIAYSLASASRAPSVRKLRTDFLRVFVDADLNEWLAAGWVVKSLAAAQGFVVLLVES